MGYRTRRVAKGERRRGNHSGFKRRTRRPRRKARNMRKRRRTKRGGNSDQPPSYSSVYGESPPSYVNVRDMRVTPADMRRYEGNKQAAQAYVQMKAVEDENKKPKKSGFLAKLGALFS